MSRGTSTVLLAALVLALTSCGEGGAPTDGEDPLAALEGDWLLVEATVDGRTLALDPARPPTLSLDDDGQLRGTACNTFGVDAEPDGNGLRLTVTDSTLMGCEPAVMELETAYVEALGRVETAGRSPDGLVLDGPDVTLTYAAVAAPDPAALLDTTWKLDGLVSGDASAPDSSVSSVAGDPATLVLASDGTVEATTGCRSLSGEWTSFAAATTLTSVQMQGSCPDELTAQDGFVISVLSRFRAEVEEDRLTLQGANGDALIYRAG